MLLHTLRCLTTLLASAMLLLLAILGGVVTLMLAVPAARALGGSWLPGVVLYGLGAAPGFLLFRILGSRAEAQYPALRSPGMRTLRLAPIVGLIAGALGLLISALRAPYPVAGIPETLWVLVGCFGALAGELTQWITARPRPTAAVA